MRGTMMDFPLTLVPILERAGKLFGAVEIVSRRPDRSIARCTYGDVYRRARRLARALELAGIGRGDRVATLMWNHVVASGMLPRDSGGWRGDAHAESAAASERAGVYREPRARPIPDRGRCAAAGVRIVPRTGEFRARVCDAV